MIDKFKRILANQIGVEPEDIENDDSFSHDLHMSASDLTDFVHNLGKEGFETNSIDLSEIETVEDLIDVLDLSAPGGKNEQGI